MNGDRPLGPQRPNGCAHSSSITDALLLEELIRQQRQDQQLRAQLLGNHNNNNDPYLGLPTTRESLSATWSLPPLANDNATLAAATLSTLHLHEDSMVLAQWLRSQQQTFRGDSTATTTDPKALWLSKGGSPTALLHAGGATNTTTSPSFHLADRVLPELQKVPTRSNKQPAPLLLPKRKKKKQRNTSSLDNDSMPAPKKRKPNSPLVATTSTTLLAPSTTFPLPLQDKALERETPKLMSFQRTWGKLEKCKMRTELFRRRLERGQVQLMGVTRSVLVQARQEATTRDTNKKDSSSE